MDTPGIHQQRGKMNRLIIQSAWRAMESAQVICLILDADYYARSQELLKKDLTPFETTIAKETRPVFILANKVDLLGDKSLLLPFFEHIHNIWPNAELFPISALSQEGIASFLANVKKALPEGPAQFPQDQLSTLPVRFMATEIIREKLFLSLRQELPYSTAVDIEAWEEDPRTKHVTIHAVIYVARPSHKAIVLGRAGQSIKQIGQNARKDIMKLLDAKVHLALWVKVRENWTDDLAFLQNLGLGQDEAPSANQHEGKTD